MPPSGACRNDFSGLAGGLEAEFPQGNKVRKASICFPHLVPKAVKYFANIVPGQGHQGISLWRGYFCDVLFALATLAGGKLGRLPG